MKNKNFIFAILVSFLILGLFSWGHLLASASPQYDVKTKSTPANFFVVNEIQVSNIDMYLDPSFNYGGWIEIYNPSSSIIYLKNIFISDDVNNLKKDRLCLDDYVLNPNSFRVYYFGANNETPSNINFKLNPEGGILYFSNTNGEILLTQIYPPGISRTSYARKADGGDEWGYTAHPSRSLSNSRSKFAVGRLADPVIDTDSRFFSQHFDFKVEIPAGTTLKYTTDGAAPGINKGVVSTDGIFHVERTSIFRFCLFQEGKLPSKVVTRSFISKQYQIGLPIISIVTANDHLFDNRIGIFVKGYNGKPGNGQSSPCNWNMDWNRPANVEYFTADGQIVVNQEADIAVSGGWSRANFPHSFKVKAKKVYDGMNYLPYEVFKSKPHLKNKTWQVRNGGNDINNRMKDAAMQEIVLSSGIDIDGQACQPVLHFLNGKFNGMLNVREPNNKDYVYANYGWDDTEIDQFQMSPDSNYCQMCGTDEAFLKWYDLSATAENHNTYVDICNLVDIDEYINYMAVEMYVGCSDFAKNNIKGFRPRIPNGKFRLVMYDLDSALGLSNSFGFFESKQTHTFNYDYEKCAQLTAEIKLVTIFLNMLKNEKFRKKFIDTFCLVAGSVFEPGRCEAIIDSMAQQRVPALKLSNKSPLALAEKLKSSLSNRQQTMIKSLKNYPRMHMEKAEEFSLKLSSNIDKSTLKINGMDVPTNKFNGSLFLPIMLKAEVPSGYKFIGWKKNLKAYVQLVPAGSRWKYFDAGSLDNQSWQQGKIANWKEGVLPMGYNLKNKEFANKIKTKLDYGTDPQNKRPTYYFYKEFNLSETPQHNDKFILSLKLDDGAICYVNGQEVGRYKMPMGNVKYANYSSGYSGAYPESTEMAVPASFFKKGLNSIAVEVHNNNAGSSDIYFDAALLMHDKKNAEEEIVSTRNIYRFRTAEKCELTACYEPLSAEEQTELNPPVVINEISADNSIFVNEYFHKNDWIELYNRTGDTINVAGMYLSDDRANTHKYQIAEGPDKYATTIAPYDYLVLWADGLLPISQIHTNFKLAREGGEVILTDAADLWADTLIYEAHSGKYSIGRYPDGDDKLFLMTMPTFGTANMLNSYAQLYLEPEYPLGVESVNMEKGQFCVKYQQHQLCISGTTAGPVHLQIYNMCGQCMMQQQVEMVGSAAVVTLDGLRRGSYIAKIVDSTGHQCHLKFLVTDEW